MEIMSSKSGRQERAPAARSSSARPREVGLDLLRLVAVLLVLGRHIWDPPDSLGDGWRTAIGAWNRGGWVGVDLFFVLSGFLVSGLLFAEYKSFGRLSIDRFVIRRGFKIYPPLWTLIAVTVTLYLVNGLPVPRLGLASELLFWQSYVPGLWEHTWSLGVEEHFYLVLALLMVMTLRLNRSSRAPLRPMLFVAGGCAVLGLGARWLTWRIHPTYNHLTHLFASHLRFDALFFGVAISYAYHFHTERFVAHLRPWRVPLLLGGILLLLPPFLVSLESTPFMFTIGLTHFYLGSGMLLVGTILSEIPRTGPIRVLALLGASSYSIYLWHLPFRTLGVQAIERLCGTTFPFGVAVPVYVLGSVMMGYLMARLVEKPSLAIRDRWFPGRGRGPIEARTNLEEQRAA